MYKTHHDQQQDEITVNIICPDTVKPVLFNIHLERHLIRMNRVSDHTL